MKSTPRLWKRLNGRQPEPILRALHRHGALAAYVTDFWWPWNGVADLPMLGRLCGHAHPALYDARVLAANLTTLGSAACARLTQQPHWEQMMHFLPNICLPKVFGGTFH